MRKIFIFKRKSFMVSLIHGFCILLIFFLFGCGGGGDDNLSVSPGIASDSSSGTGSAVFTVTWHDDSVTEDSENSLVTAQEESVPLSCEDVGVEEIICEVYEVKDGSSTFLTSGGPWKCSLHSETIYAIVAGENRTFVLLGYGKGNKENILYHGEVSGVNITAGQINDAGTMEAFPFFIDELLSPPYGSSVPSDQLSLNWTPIENAYEYRVQVSKDIDFTPPLTINETTIDPPYNPSGLSVGQTYYWKVFPIDFYANQGAESTEVWSFTISCTYSISPTSSLIDSSGDTGTVSVTAPSGCGWTAASNNTWITVTSGSSGSGNGTVDYSVDPNSSTNSRTGTMTIAGKTFTVTQSGISCTYSISPTSSLIDSSGDTGTVSVKAPSVCDWTAASNNTWITVTSGSSGSGNGTVGYSVDPNSSSNFRTGTMTIAEKTFTVTQEGLSCTYSISPESRTVPSSGGTYGIEVTSSVSDCTWTATPSESWIKIESGSGSGDGAVTYSVSKNPHNYSRSATITVAGKIHSVTQDGK